MSGDPLRSRIISVVISAHDTIVLSSRISALVFLGPRIAMTTAHRIHSSIVSTTEYNNVRHCGYLASFSNTVFEFWITPFAHVSMESSFSRKMESLVQPPPAYRARRVGHVRWPLSPFLAEWRRSVGLGLVHFLMYAFTLSLGDSPKEAFPRTRTPAGHRPCSRCRRSPNMAACGIVGRVTTIIVHIGNVIQITFIEN
jgi:hypothetical protein